MPLLSQTSMKIEDFFEQYRAECEACNGGKPVCIPEPDTKNGFQGSAVMFINERPGRIGSGKSNKMSFENEDPTANWFKELFAMTGLDRREIFITNARIYYPQGDPGYKDRPPTLREIACSAPILKSQIEAIRPRLLVSMGNTALAILRLVFPESQQLRRFVLKRDIGTVIADTPMSIYLLYHTSRRAQVTRNREMQKKDWSRIAALIAR
jgi:uracil-DNA glycosylase family 4